ncbi:GDP-mannose 4,6-dehydratase [Pseudoalteromonas sp. OOF1S-7]|uniref:GDP-mannose 4,6-dehydratase n=1 Tax=Pseudoalteromonas sp. OOF1S-7 TaxID=2917757 RepID=UPI001EF4505E|nr:GDP-mannose 4,6-dehydratase [Pseudoalteromonas sp. OOF1S-7]MCG7537120.1 GDP-mannose 4,6-dehydratase [Pseudoalteromonas sp. OOF1S-7]
MNKNILVLGSNSPSGAAFCRSAGLQGNKVIATSRSVEAADLFLPYKWEKELDVEFHQLDINKDIAKFLDLAKKHRITHVVNFASQSMVGQSWQHPEHWMQTNVVGLVSLLEAMRHLSGLENYIHFSTPEVYGSTESWIKEHTNYAPSTPYASSRAAGDMNVKLWADTYELPCIITRAANIYGAGQQLYRIIPKTFLSCMLGRKLPLHGGGHSERAFIHINDVANALLLILEQDKPGETYHISPHEKISIRDLVASICTLCETDFEEVVEISEDRVGKDQAYLLESSKLMNTLQWEPKVTLEQGLMEVHDWCSRNVDFLSQQSVNYVHKR